MKLELYNGREPNIIEVTLINGDKVLYKMTADFTVEEIERLYELEQKISDTKTDSMARWSYMAEQVRLSISRFHPDITTEFLKKNLTPLQMAQVILFMQESAFKIKGDASSVEDVKKNPSSA